MDNRLHPDLDKNSLKSLRELASRYPAFGLSSILAGVSQREVALSCQCVFFVSFYI